MRYIDFRYEQCYNDCESVAKGERKMKIVTKELTCIMQNSDSLHSYFGWPSIAKLKNGKLAAVASGFRLAHICPFGKTVIAYSEDNGRTYTPPAPVIDTCLDDRDGGIGVFGKSGVIVTSFNNTVEEQKNYLSYEAYHTGGKKFDDYKKGYFGVVDREKEAEQLGSVFKISNDHGVTFGKLKKSPISSPHGPIELKNGTVLWVGRTFAQEGENDRICAYSIEPDGSMAYIGAIPKIEDPIDESKFAMSCEPDTVQTDSGALICHIRVHFGKVMTLYQSKSYDLGKTWSTPVRIIDEDAGGPAQLLKLKSGMLACSYGERSEPFGIKVMFSSDEGETWTNTTRIYNNNGISSDIGYPCTVELDNGELLTVFYAREKTDGNAKIFQIRWSMDNEN